MVSRWVVRCLPDSANADPTVSFENVGVVAEVRILGVSGDYSWLGFWGETFQTAFKTLSEINPFCREMLRPFVSRAKEGRPTPLPLVCFQVLVPTVLLGGWTRRTASRNEE